MRSFIVLNQAGCLLPLLIILNLFFGWMIFKPVTWLVIGLILTALFLFNSIITSKKVSSYSTRYKNVVDVEGKPVDDLKEIR